MAPVSATSATAAYPIHDEHTQTYQRLVAVAASYAGFLGIEPARNADGSGVAAIYWKDLQSIAAFARDPEHVVAKKNGREVWYRAIAVVRAFSRSLDEAARADRTRGKAAQ